MSLVIHGNCTVLKPPLRTTLHSPSVFLSGSVEVDAPIKWQDQIAQLLSHLNVGILNPLRDDWDSSWREDIANPVFKEQVLWELDHMESADIIALYLSPAAANIISMLEFGLNARAGKVVACCPEGYARRGNVQVVCERFGIPLVETIEELAAMVEERVHAQLAKKHSGQREAKTATE